MVKKKYLVNLDKELVEKIQEEMGLWGGRLSPIVNNLLILWYDDEDKMKEMLKKIKEGGKP